MHSNKTTRKEKEQAREKFDAALAARIKELREATGLSQKRFAESTPYGWTQATIWKWETRFLRPSAFNLRQLAKAFKCPVDDLLPK